MLGSSDEEASPAKRPRPPAAAPPPAADPSEWGTVKLGSIPPNMTTVKLFPITASLQCHRPAGRWGTSIGAGERRQGGGGRRCVLHEPPDEVADRDDAEADQAVHYNVVVRSGETSAKKCKCERIPDLGS